MALLISQTLHADPKTHHIWSFQAEILKPNSVYNKPIRESLTLCRLKPSSVYLKPIGESGPLTSRRALNFSGVANIGVLGPVIKPMMSGSEVCRSNESMDGGYMETEAMLNHGSLGTRKAAWIDRWESAVNSSSKWLVFSLFGVAVIWKHDGEVMWAAMGSVINSMISMALKRLLNQQRPSSASRVDPGMPSSHAQSISFITNFCSWLRVSQRFHTISQVLVGTLLGSLLGITWFFLWHRMVSVLFLSSQFVRIIVFVGSGIFCLGFVFNVAKKWSIYDD
ncbi:hypothetical protein AMTRI_Chr03g143290 [Amborella trichopoda]